MVRGKKSSASPYRGAIDLTDWPWASLLGRRPRPSQMASLARRPQPQSSTREPAHDVGANVAAALPPGIFDGRRPKLHG